MGGIGHVPPFSVKGDARRAVMRQAPVFRERPVQARSARRTQAHSKQGRLHRQVRESRYTLAVLRLCPSALFDLDDDGARRVPNFHGQIPLSLVAALSAALAGCAAGSGATQPTSGSAGITGSISPVRYELTPEERGWDCSRLSNAIEQAVPDLARLGQRATSEREGPPASLTRAVARAVGEPGSGYPSAGELARTRERLASYNAALGQLGCPTVDIEARLAAYETERASPNAPNDETDALDRSIDRPSIEPADLRF